MYVNSNGLRCLCSTKSKHDLLFSTRNYFFPTPLKEQRAHSDWSITQLLFFSVLERAEFNKSCNLIGFGSRRNFLIRPAHGVRNPSLSCVSLCDDLKFPFFFDTESVYIQKLPFIRQEFWKYNSNKNISL